MKVRLSAHLYDELDTCESVRYLFLSANERCNIVLKRVCSSKPTGKKSKRKETNGTPEQIVNGLQGKKRDRISRIDSFCEDKAYAVTRRSGM